MPRSCYVLEVTDRRAGYSVARLFTTGDVASVLLEIEKIEQQAGEKFREFLARQRVSIWTIQLGSVECRVDLENLTRDVEGYLRVDWNAVNESLPTLCGSGLAPGEIVPLMGPSRPLGNLAVLLHGHADLTIQGEDEGVQLPLAI